MIPPKDKPVVRLTGHDGNAFAVMGTVRKALKRAGADTEYVDKYFREATAGDYNTLLAVTMDYVDVE
ncbi:hypothetical protein [Desulfosudis oleivorans]|nr:hypothetical protein [Desulfosudis oleivorans]